MSEVAWTSTVMENWGLVAVLFVIVAEGIYILWTKSLLATKGYSKPFLHDEPDIMGTVFGKIFAILITVILFTVGIPLIMDPKVREGILLLIGIIVGLVAWVYLNHKIVDEKIREIVQKKR